MRNKAFTLIELLAVIAILAMLLLVAVPKVLSVINDSEKSSFISSVQMLAKVGETYMANNWKDIEKPEVGNGIFYDINTLRDEGYADNVESLLSGAVVIYNNAGRYEVYVFANSDKYVVDGFKYGDIKSNVTLGNTNTLSIMPCYPGVGFSLVGNDMTCFCY